MTMTVDGPFNGCCPHAQRAAVVLHARSVGAEVVAEFRDVKSGRMADHTRLAAARGFGAKIRLWTCGGSGAGLGTAVKRGGMMTGTGGLGWRSETAR